jgi:RNA polymerase sigma-70 factor (ECF subfamily)
MMPQSEPFVLLCATVEPNSRMAQLVDSYRAACPTVAAEAGPEALALECTLATLFARGRMAHPSLPEVPDVAYVEHLARCGAPVAAGPDAVHAEDLFLACAALAGSVEAVARLRHAHRPVVAGYLRSIDTTPAFIDEVEQRLWEALLVGHDGAPPKLATYSGRGPLAGFVGVSAQRLALSGVRHDAAEGRARAGAAVEARPAAGDAELAFIKARYRDGFQDVIREALTVLDDRERMIFRMYVVDGLSVERIAKVYGVSQSTVSRWVAKARDAVTAEARRLLRERLLLSESEFESVANLMISQLDLSVSRVLGGTAR